jgi:hypothetical protein
MRVEIAPKMQENCSWGPKVARSIYLKSTSIESISSSSVSAMLSIGINRSPSKMSVIGWASSMPLRCLYA